MKKYLVLMMALMLPVMAMAAKKEKQNILVWGEVRTASDGKDYLTMYKNCPAEVTAQFHFIYKDKTKSVMYDMFMPDSVAEVLDPVPVEKPVKEVVLDNIIYSALQEDGQVYRTKDPDDPVLAMLLVDMFDLYRDIFWWDAAHRARYYHNKHYTDWTPSTSKYNKTHGGSTSAPKDINLDKLDDTALLIGAAAVAAASVGMAIAVSKQWDVPDDRFPYFSFSPQMQYFTQTGTMRDVVQLKYRFGNYGGMSLLADMGYTTGSMNERNLFDPGFTWSIGVGFDLGAFSLSLRGKPSTSQYDENFLTCQAVYDIFITRDFALDLSAGAGVFEHNNDYYLDIPFSVGVLWKF